MQHVLSYNVRMTEFFIDILQVVQNLLGNKALLLITVAMQLTVFLAYVVVWLIKGRLCNKNLLTYGLFSCAIILLERSFSIVTGEQNVLIFALSVNATLLGVLITLPSRKKKDNTVQVQLARELDNKYKEQMLEEKKKATLSQPVERIVPDVQIEREQKQVDFSHVKSVINRLERYNLSQNDQRQVRALENAINNAESGRTDFNTKESVNEGLGALLKIMSKYGV